MSLPPLSILDLALVPPGESVAEGLAASVELARRAKAISPDLPVIYATGYDDPQMELSPRERCIRKPYMFDDVSRLLAGLGFA